MVKKKGELPLSAYNFVIHDEWLYSQSYKTNKHIKQLIKQGMSKQIILWGNQKGQAGWDRLSTSRMRDNDRS